MSGPPSFTSVVARPYVQFSDSSYNNEHAPPSLGSVAMAQLQLSDPFTENYYNNEPAISMESVAMVQLQLSLGQLTDDASYSNEQAPSMGYERGVSQSASDGFSYNVRPPSLTNVAGRDESYSGVSPQARERVNYTDGNHMNTSSVVPQINKNFDLKEALQVQLEIQKRLHEQLEVQRQLQLRVEVQGKYLKAVIEKEQETVGRQNIGEVGLETPNLQLPEWISQEMMGLNYLHGRNNAPLKLKDKYEPENACDLNLDISQKFQLPNFEHELDLNAHEEYGPASRKQFDLNGVSW